MPKSHKTSLKGDETVFFCTLSPSFVSMFGRQRKEKEEEILIVYMMIFPIHSNGNGGTYTPHTFVDFIATSIG